MDPVNNQQAVEVVRGNLLTQEVEVIVNSWNRIVIPWWLLVPQGVSGQIKKYAGSKPFKEIGGKPLKLGDAVLTSAGRLPYKGIIHVAGINLLWRANEISIRSSMISAIKLVQKEKFKSVAFPVVGSGSGGYDTSIALDIMLAELNKQRSDAKIKIVVYNGDKVLQSDSLE